MLCHVRAVGVTHTAGSAAQADQGYAEAKQALRKARLAVLRDAAGPCCIVCGWSAGVTSGAAAQADQGYAEAKQASREARLAVLRDAEVVVSTLIAAGGDLLSLCAGQPGFDAIIIDEVGPSAQPCISTALLAQHRAVWHTAL